MEKMKMQTGDVANENFRKLAELFPNAVTETIDENGEVVRAIDKDILMQEISTRVVEGNEERYQFTWPDKRQAMRLASTPIAATLRPCREESVNFDTTENLYIEGDNLDVLKLLRETYLGKVKMIYIDPPYNTGNDFVYDDDFAEDAGEFQFRDNQYDEQGNRLVQNTESNGRFHTDWLNMIYPRLKVAKDLLADDGVIFISIDYNEVDNLKKVCDEIFGAKCFVTNCIWRSSDNSNNDAKQFSNDYNSTLIYSKTSGWQPQKQMDPEKQKHFKNPDNDPRGAWFDGNPLNSPNYRENLIYDIISPCGNVIHPPKNGWRWSKETLEEKIKTGEIYFNQDETNIKRRTYLADMDGVPPSNLWVNLEKTGHNRQAKYELLKLLPEDVFDTPKPVKLLSFILSLIKKSQDSIILDFFSGSSTTADAVMQVNAQDSGKRKFIMVQLPEDLDQSLKKASNDNKTVIKNAISLCDALHVPHLLSEVAKERIRRAGKKIMEENGEKAANLDIGFRVLKLDSSNMEDVYYTPDKTSQDDLLSLISNIKPDRTPEDLLFQVMLELGVTLSSKIEECEISGKKVFKVAGNFLIACFDENVTDEVVKAIAKEQPTYAVLRDSSFANDSVAANFEQIFATYSPDTVRRVL